jgi:hypothetical protein
LSIGLPFLWNEKKVNTKQQINIITNGIKNVSKLLVTEASFSEIYNYEDVQNYLFETIEFKKKIILFVNAKVLVSYDLKKLQVEIDSVHHKLLIIHIPKEELNIIPDYKYYDFQQSMWNTFTKEELNKIQEDSLDKLVSAVTISNVKEKAKQQLVKELENLLLIANLLDWKVIDQSDIEILKEIDFKLKT